MQSDVESSVDEKTWEDITGTEMDERNKNIT
jgi:hypothetical protein